MTLASNVLDLTSLIRRMAEERVKADNEPGTTKKARLAAWKKHHLTTDQRKQARELFEAVPDVLAVYDSEVPAELTPQQAAILMEEHTALAEAELVIKARKDRIKEMFFGHLDTQFTEAGLIDPELTPGSLPVPSQNKKFCREGGGRQDPTLDVETLRSALGDEVVDSVTNIVHHPAQHIESWDEQVVDDERLAAWLVSHPDKIEEVRDAVIPGAPKTTRFVVRNLES